MKPVNIVKKVALTMALTLMFACPTVISHAEETAPSIDRYEAYSRDNGVYKDEQEMKDELRKESYLNYDGKEIINPEVEEDPVLEEDGSVDTVGTVANNLVKGGNGEEGLGKKAATWVHDVFFDNLIFIALIALAAVGLLIINHKTKKAGGGKKHNKELN